MFDLLKWRERLGISQRLAAVELGCSRAAYMKWEKGPETCPRYIWLACKQIETIYAENAAHDEANA